MNLRRRWADLWMRWSGHSRLGRTAMRIAGWPWPPYYARHRMAARYPSGYICGSAELAHGQLHLGPHVFLDERVLLYQDRDGGALVLGAGVHLHRDTIVQTGAGGGVRIGANSSVQARCVLSAYVGDIVIGEGVQVAAHCGFFSYAHGMAPDRPMRDQPLTSRGGIVIEDDVWIGYGATILDGAHIGAGAVIGAGSVVSGHIPAHSIAAGVPARIIKKRGTKRWQMELRASHGGGG